VPGIGVDTPQTELVFAGNTAKDSKEAANAQGTDPHPSHVCDLRQETAEVFFGLANSTYMTARNSDILPCGK